MLTLTALALNTEKLIDDAPYTSLSRLYGDGVCRAIQHTSTTFHTGLAMNHPRPVLVDNKDRMRADDGAEATTDTSLPIIT